MFTGTLRDCQFPCVSLLMSPHSRPTLSSKSLYADVDTNHFFEDVSCCLTITEKGCEKARSNRDLTLARTAGVREMSEDHNKMLRSPSRLWLKFNRCCAAAFTHVQDTEGQVNPTSRTSLVCLPPVQTPGYVAAPPPRLCSYSAPQREISVSYHIHLSKHRKLILYGQVKEVITLENVLSRKGKASVSVHPDILCK